MLLSMSITGIIFFGIYGFMGALIAIVLQDEIVPQRTGINRIAIDAVIVICWPIVLIVLKVIDIIDQYF